MLEKKLLLTELILVEQRVYSYLILVIIGYFANIGATIKMFLYAHVLAAN